MLSLAGCLGPMNSIGQIDPVKRELIQLGYNAALEGHPPLSAYAFFYLNEPDFVSTNMALRLAIAPTYLDSELGFRHLLGPNTDLGIDLAGGGFADSYDEIRQGTFIPSESFDGHGGEFGLSVYHLFNPGQTIPLYGVLRGLAHYATYSRNSDTAGNFELPPDHETYSVRAGVRWGGREPVLFPAFSMELSAWYEGRFRSTSATYGFDDRTLEPQSHLFWAQAGLGYTLPKLKHSFHVDLTAGTSLDADRFSAYRLGGLLPLVSEFPLSLPGYYYQEISAKDFVLLSGNYIIPFDQQQHWNLDLSAATAWVNYLPGLSQPGNWQSGVGAGLLYKARSWRVAVGYGYGINAIRSHGRGADSVGVLMQFDLEQAKGNLFRPSQPGLWRGIERIFGLFGD